MKIKPITSQDINDFMVAVWQGNLDVIDVFLKNGLSVNYKLPLGETFLMEAINCGQNELVTYLLANGADPNLKNDRGNTALYEIFSDQANLQCAQALIEAGCTIDSKNEEGDTALMFGVKEDLESIDYKALQKSNGHSDYFMFLIEHGANVLALNNQQQSPAILISDHTKAYSKPIFSNALIQACTSALDKAEINSHMPNLSALAPNRRSIL